MNSLKLKIPQYNKYEKNGTFLQKLKKFAVKYPKLCCNSLEVALKYEERLNIDAVNFI